MSIALPYWWKGDDGSGGFGGVGEGGEPTTKERKERKKNLFDFNQKIFLEFLEFPHANPFVPLPARNLRGGVGVGFIFSAIITGILIAFNLPASAPWWLPIMGSAFAIIVVKQFFGGLGSNFMNPALAARAMLLTSWPTHMATFTGTRPDVVATATPLAIMKYGMSADSTASATVEAATSASSAAGAELPSINL